MEAEIEAEHEANWQKYGDRFKELRDDWCRARRGMAHRNSAQYDYRIKCFDIDSRIVSAVLEHDASLLPNIKALNSCKTPYEFQRSVKTMIECKEVHKAIKLRQYDQLSTKLIVQKNSTGKLEWYGISVPGLANRWLSEHVIVQHRSKTDIDLIQIDKVVDGRVHLDMSKAGYFDRFKLQLFNVYFIVLNYYDRLYKATDEFSTSSTMKMILTEDYGSPSRSAHDKIKLSSTDKSELRDRLDKLDQCQRQAVIGILQARCRPKAYIIRGAPGTGKTHTIVEAVVQIFKRSDNMNVLVCAGSNNCADYLHEKLALHIPNERMRRLKRGESPNRFHDCRVMVTTNCKANSFIDYETFDYVFIDDANHADIPESLVPIQFLNDDGCLVLAGDVNSLNYVAKSMKALGKGFELSVLQYLLDFKVYKRDSGSGKLNSDYIMDLRQCHRSDTRIMSLLNELFYNGSIESSYQTPESLLSDMQLSWPVQFMPVAGPEETPVGAISAQNEDEANTCLNIIVRLHKMGCNLGQIGVISPFKMQVELIKSKLKNAFKTLAQRNQCKVGTIDDYQGEERDIVIISTVGSSPHTEDSQFHKFVSDPNRFNVSISRAKWLVIVVGNLGALNRGEYLPKLIANGRTCEIFRWLRTDSQNLSRQEEPAS